MGQSNTLQGNASNALDRRYEKMRKDAAEFYFMPLVRNVSKNLTEELIREYGDECDGFIFFLMGMFNTSGSNIATRYFQKALPKLQAAKDPESQNALGFMYKAGYYVARDYSKALEHYSTAAKQGYAPAQNNLGFLHANGLGVNLNHATACTFYKKAAKQNNVAAQNNLGNLSYLGQAVPLNYQKAYKYYQRAAALGYGLALINMGNMYYFAHYVPPNYLKAIWYYELAYNQGETEPESVVLPWKAVWAKFLLVLIATTEDESSFSQRAFPKELLGAIFGLIYVDHLKRINWRH